MKRYGCYLVCKEHIKSVRKFLNKFFVETKGDYNSPNWITFEIPNSNFIINLMFGKEQEITQNMTFEIYFNSKNELQKFAKKHRHKIKRFRVTNTNQKYIYNYVEILGPRNICKIEASYSEDIK